MTVIHSMTSAYMDLAYYALLGTVIAIDMAVIILVQLGYQIKAGKAVIIGGTGPRRVLVTMFGYEIAIGGR